LLDLSKRLEPFTQLHGVMPQWTQIVMKTAVRTSLIYSYSPD